MKRNLWFWLYFIAAILLAIYFATRIIMNFMGYGPIARVKTMHISADTGNTDLTTIAAATGVASGTNTHSVNLKIVNDRLLATPWVRESAVRRLPNGNLSIKVHLYRAVAALNEGNYYYPLSAEGKKIQKPSEDKAPGTVVFRGSVPKNIGAITKAATNLVEDLDYLEFIDRRRWNLVTNGGITVMLPEKDVTDQNKDPVAAIASLVVLNKKYNILKKDIKVIDMRDTARILIK